MVAEEAEVINKLIDSNKRASWLEALFILSKTYKQDVWKSSFDDFM